MMEAPLPIRVLLVDDHRIIIDGLKGLLDPVADIECVGTAANGAEALHVVEHLPVDVVLLDISMPVLDGLATAERMKARPHPPRIIVLSMHDEAAMVHRMIELGADGYLVKNCGRDELLLAIRDVHAGRKHFGSALTESLLEQHQEASPRNALLKDLSERETEVLAALAEGLTNKQIGTRLFISPRTVDTHRTNLMKKLGTHNVAGLVRIAIKAGLVK